MIEDASKFFSPAQVRKLYEETCEKTKELNIAAGEMRAVVVVNGTEKIVRLGMFRDCGKSTSEEPKSAPVAFTPG